MNAPHLLWTTAVLAGLAVASALVWISAQLRNAAPPSPALRMLPWPIRLAGVPATLMAPWVSKLLPERSRQQSIRKLDSFGWHPNLTPELWIATRLAYGLTCGALTLMVAGFQAWPFAMLFAIAGYLAGAAWLHRRAQAREQMITRELPPYLDMLTVCVEAGATLTAGIRLIVTQAPASPLREYFDRVLREVRGGRPRAEAFLHVAGIFGTENLITLANALAHAESSGMSLGQVLRTQSVQRTAERFVRAEKLAMQAPVKMLGPLILCIFPCTFIVLGVPVAVRLMEAFRS